LAATRSRPHGREHARPSSGGVAAEHATKIYAAAIVGIVIIVAFLALTSTGHVIDAATQHFMLFYAGVFALIALCASTGLGLIATDRVFLNAGHRVLAQSAHRAASFGAVAFLIIHIVTEILAQRVHVLDAVVPFLSPFRTFYIGLGTIASDLIILLVITGIMRGRFNAHGRAWRWRAIHYTSYASFVFGVWHGLLAGRPAKPYVDWSYGLLVALVLLALAVRIVSNSLRPKENLSGPAVPMSGDSASAPMRAAAMFASLGAARANTGGQPRLMVSSVQEPALSGPPAGYSGSPLLTAPLPVGTGELSYEPGYEGPPRYLGAPRAANSGPMPRAATGPMPRVPTGPFPRPGTGPMPRATTGPMAAAGGTPSWPGADHPSGPMPRAATGPFPRASTGPMAAAGGTPSWPGADHPSGPMPRAATGPFPSISHEPTGSAGGPQSWPSFRPVTGPMPQAASGPMDGGRRPRPTAGPGSGPMPRAGTGPMPRAGTGPMPRAGTGPMPRAGTGPMPRAASGPTYRQGTGPQPRAATGPMAAADGRPSWPASGPPSGPMPRAAAGPQAWPSSGPPSGPMPRAGTGPAPTAGSGRGPAPWPGFGPTAPDGAAPGRPARSRPGPPTGPIPGPGTGPMPRAASGSGQRRATGPRPRTPGWQNQNQNPRAQGRPGPRPGSGPRPQADGAGPQGYYRSQGDYPSPGGYPSPADYPSRGGYAGQGGRGEQAGPGRRARPAPGQGGGANRAQMPWDGGLPEPDPELRYREPGPGMPGYRGSRDARYGGDKR
jgi:hypothetical protein